MRFSYLLLVIIGSFFLFLSCKETLSGSENENQLPTTSLTVQDINLPPGTLLSSRIRLTWWGNDPDGFLLGFEYAINDTSEGAWTFTTTTDSIFTLPVGAGLASDNVLFKVRAVDNDEARDPVGARIVLPVRNTVPTIDFNTIETPPDTTYGIASMGWTVADQDGLVSLARVEVAFNDTMNAANWVEVPLPTEEDEGRTFVTLTVDDPAAAISTANVRLGRSLSTPAQPITFTNLFPGQDNTVFIRVIDNSGAISQVQTHTWFIKRQTSRVLFLNDDDGINSQANQAFHLQQLAANGIVPDVMIINDGEAAGGAKVRISEAFPTVIDPTLIESISQWDHIYWVSNNLDRNITFAQNITSDFIGNGGTIFVTIPTKVISSDDPVFDFLPVGQVGQVSGAQTSFRVLANTDFAHPSDPTYPVLRTTQQVLGITPLEAISGSEALYEADFRVQIITGQVLDYTGFEDIAIKSSEGNLVYFGWDLTLLNGNNNVADLINRICIQELGFQQ